MRQRAEIVAKVHRACGKVGAQGLDGLDCGFPAPLRWLVCIASWGGGWEHVSVHAELADGQSATPAWDEMRLAKEVFWHAEEAVVQFHPPASHYVNKHPHVLHLWKSRGGSVPMPPLEFV